MGSMEGAIELAKALQEEATMLKISAVAAPEDELRRLAARVAKNLESMAQKLDPPAPQDEEKEALEDEGAGASTAQGLDFESKKSLTGHKDAVLCLVVLPGAPARVASGSGDSTIRIWNMESCSTMATFTGHTKGVTCLDVSSTGSNLLLVSGSEDRTCRVWNIESGSCEKVLKGHMRAVTGAAFLSEGDREDPAQEETAQQTPRRLVSGSNRELHLWDLASGECLCKLEGHKDKIFCLAPLTSPNLVATGSNDKTILIWDLEARASTLTMEGHSHAICCLLALSSDRIASGSKDSTIKIWNCTDGQCLQTFSGHLSYIRRLITFGASQVVSASSDRTIKIWALATGRCLATLEGHTDSVMDVQAIDVEGPDSERKACLVSASDDLTLRLWRCRQ